MALSQIRPLTAALRMQGIVVPPMSCTPTLARSYPMLEAMPRGRKMTGCWSV